MRLAAVAETDARGVASKPSMPTLSTSNRICPPAFEARGDQVFHHLVLPVDGDGAAAGQLVHVDAMPAAVEAQLDAVMHEAFASHAVADARAEEQVHGALLQNTGADPLFHVLAALGLDDDGLDASRWSRCESSRPAGPAPTMPT